MLLPGSERAFIDEVKVRDYLLSSAHPVGKFKAAFFVALGYSSADWQRLQHDLLEIGRLGEAQATLSTDYGQKYEVRATITGPASRTARIITAWIVLSAEDFPRFVTAYPT